MSVYHTSRVFWVDSKNTYLCGLVMGRYAQNADYSDDPHAPRFLQPVFFNDAVIAAKYSDLCHGCVAEWLVLVRTNDGRALLAKSRKNNRWPSDGHPHNTPLMLLGSMLRGYRQVSWDMGEVCGYCGSSIWIAEGDKLMTACARPGCVGAGGFDRRSVIAASWAKVPDDVLDRAFVHVEARIERTTRKASLLWLGKWARMIDAEMTRRAQSRVR